MIFEHLPGPSSHVLAHVSDTMFQYPSNRQKNCNSQDFDDDLCQGGNGKKFMHRTMSDLTIYDYGISEDISDSNTIDELKGSNSTSSIVNLIPSNAEYTFSNNWGNNRLQNSSSKCYSCSSMPVNTKNKMALHKSKMFSLGLGRVNKKYHNIYGQSLQVGHGFPAKTPIIADPSAEMIEKSDKSFNNLENLIQRLKKDSDLLSLSLHCKDDATTSSTSNEKSANSSFSDGNILGKEISRVSEDINTQKKEFIEMESSILNDFTDIKSSISQLLEERKEIQQQHRIWLQSMREKINQTKENAKDTNILTLNSFSSK